MFGKQISDTVTCRETPQLEDNAQVISRIGELEEELKRCNEEFEAYKRMKRSDIPRMEATISELIQCNLKLQKRICELETHRNCDGELVVHNSSENISAACITSNCTLQSLGCHAELHIADSLRMLKQNVEIERRIQQLEGQDRTCNGEFQAHEHAQRSCSAKESTGCLNQSLRHMRNVELESVARGLWEQISQLSKTQNATATGTNNPHQFSGRFPGHLQLKSMPESHSADSQEFHNVHQQDVGANNLFTRQQGMLGGENDMGGPFCNRLPPRTVIKFPPGGLSEPLPVELETDVLGTPETSPGSCDPNEPLVGRLLTNCTQDIRFS